MIFARRALLLAACLVFASGLFAEGKSGTATLGLVFTHYDVPDSEALAYCPFEIGYIFPSGLHLKTAVDVFFYELDEVVVDDGLAKEYRYEYSMLNWMTTLLYYVDTPWPLLRPYTGLSFEAISGEKLARAELVGPDKTPMFSKKPLKEAVSGITGSAAILGLSWGLTEDWLLLTQGRYLYAYDDKIDASLMYSLGINYLF